MSTTGISAPAEGRLVISNKWLEANHKNKSAYIDVPNRASSPVGGVLNPSNPRTSTAGMQSGRGVSVRI